MRLFLAIYPPKNVLDQLRDVVREFAKDKRNLRNVPIDQLHLSLRFIGPGVSENSKEIITEALKGWEGNYGQPLIQIKKVQFGFEFQDFPSLLVATTERSDSLIKVNDDIHTVFRELKLRDTIRWKERYSENFHITLARLKKTATKSTAKDLKDKTKNMKEFVFDPFVAEEMYLVESIMDSGTSQYKKLEKIKL